MIQMKMLKNKRLSDWSIQKKLLLIFLSTTAILLLINIYMYISINRTTSRIDEIYMSNADLSELQGNLTQIQTNMTEYLNTKASDVMEDYYRSVQDYRQMLEKLNTETVNEEIQMMQKNIYNMSDSYLVITDAAVEAKRGRNIERYQETYEQAGELYGYLNAYIYSLNNKQFQNNSGNYETFLSALEYSEAFNILILVMVSLLNGILIIMLTRGIIRPLQQLSEAANKVADGQLDIELTEPRGNDEVGVVTRAFNQMVLSIQTYIGRLKQSMAMERDLKEKELLMANHLKDAQLKYLQAQINPHFLFNTLNAGAQLAMLEEADRTYKYVQNVADFFRYNMKISTSVTLSEEIKLVDNYVYILNERFSGEIHFYKKVDETLTNIQVPSMILQPIVENCVNYGIRNIDWDGIIELAVYEEDRYICVSIRDNGVGISRERINEIMQGLIQVNGDAADSNGIGLNNVIERLRLFYGIEEVLEITSEGENMGTEVAIFIPK